MHCLKWGIRYLISVLVGGLMLSWALASQAAKKMPSNDIGFSVAAKLPQNQLHPKNSFFDLKMTAGKTQLLKAIIYNVTTRDIQVKTAIHTAYTNSNGVIEYVTPAQEFDPSLKYPMSQMTKLTGAKTVTVPANGSKVVTAKVTMPTGKFNGVILGGWYFRRLDTKATSTVKGSMNVHNQYSYVIGMKFTEGTVPAPELKLGAVKAGLQNYHRGIFPEIRNVTAIIVPNLTVKATVTSKNSGHIIQQAQQKNVQLAPNSVFRYPMLTGKKPLQAGNYHLKLVAKNKAHRWVFDRDFKISSQTAKTYNAQDVDHAGISVIWFVIMGALGMLVLVLIGLVSYFWLKKRRQA